MKRHPNISTRVAQNLTKSRASVNEEKIRNWFAEVLTFLDEEQLTNILRNPNRVFNCDETALYLSPKENAVLAKRGSKAVYSVVANDEKECLTALITGSAAGTIAPSMVVYPYKRVPAIIAKNMPQGWAIGVSENGWMTGEAFYEFIANVFHPWLIKKNIELPVILFLDGHASHLTLHLSKFCKANQIILIALLPNSTHILQPLDVSVFRPLKVEWKKTVREWRMEHNGDKIKREHFASLLFTVLDNESQKCNLISGFRTCGLYPFDPNAIKYNKYFGNELSIVPETREKSVTCHSGLNYVEFIEQNIEPEKLKSFKSTIGQWNGSIEDKNLYLFWKKTCSNQESPEIGDETLNNNVDMLIESDLQKLLNDCDFILDNTILNAQTPIKIVDPEPPPPLQPQIQQQPIIPTPFKKNLFWPEITTSVKTPKIKTPAVAVSDQWIDFHEKKRVMKTNKENLKLENKQKRLDKLKTKSVREAVRKEKKCGIQPQEYVIFRYGKIFFPGLVLQVTPNKVFIKSMEVSSDGESWVWPEKDDILWYKKTDILQKIKEPKILNNEGVCEVPEIKSYYLKLQKKG